MISVHFKQHTTRDGILLSWLWFSVFAVDTKPHAKATLWSSLVTLRFARATCLAGLEELVGTDQPCSMNTRSYCTIYIGDNELMRDHATFEEMNTTVR
jgi:hypothetical protein